MIPARLIRTVPAATSDDVERYWRQATDLHPGWGAVTFRDPIDPDEFPLTSDAWPLCTSGAQLAGLVRLEVLWHLGGFYLDSDLELFRPLDDLRCHGVVGTFEDANVVPDWFIGAEAHHPAIGECIREALRRIADRSNDDWQTGCHAWATGPGVTNTVLRSWPGVHLLDPHVLAPYHYTEPHRADEDHMADPRCLGAHRWAHSWIGH